MASTSRDAGDQKIEAEVMTTVFKVPMHCNVCEEQLKAKFLLIDGVDTVMTDMESQTCTVVGTAEHEKLVLFVEEVLMKHAGIFSSASGHPSPNDKEIPVPYQCRTGYPK